MRSLMMAMSMLALLCAGCGGGQAVKKPAPKISTPAPGWVDKVPLVEGKVYAIGHSGPTFWPQDALNNAAEDARGKLAIGLQAKMEMLTKVAEHNGQTSGFDLVKAATDMVMQNSRVEATWVDTAGERGEPDNVWALAFIEVQAAKLKGSGQAVEAGRQLGVPPWLDRLPTDQGRLYAYGYSGPTFRPDDAVEYAGDDAVENLAKALRSHVQAYRLLVENTTGMSVDEFSNTERPDDDFKELVKKKAKVEQTWVDKKGARAGYPPGSVWALAWVDVSSTKGGYQEVANEDTGPALTSTGEIGEPQKPENKKPAPAPQPAPTAAPPHAATPTAPAAPQAAPSAPPSAPTPAPVAATPPASTPAPQAAPQAAPPPPPVAAPAVAVPASSTAPAAPPAVAAEPARAPVGIASPRSPARKVKAAPYPSEGEKCKAGFESTGGWCLPIE
jgi:hypothetical protein